MGLLEPGVLELAPPDGVVPHVGPPTVRFEALGASFDQCAAARRQRGAGLSVAAPDDRRAVAECVGGGVVCRAPAARGIGGLGGGTQGCAQRLASACWR